MSNFSNKESGAIARAFQSQRRLRAVKVEHFGGLEAVKSHPLAVMRFRPDEGGTVNTSLALKLAPVDGLMRSKVFVDVKQVFVPYQAMEVLELDTQDDAGVTEMAKRRLMAGEGIGLETEGVVSKAAFVHGRNVSGDPRVSKTIRLAYNAAMNHLRRQRYYNATLLTKADTAIQPALLTANILERLRGVVEPENLIDGAVNLSGDIPIKGIGLGSNVSVSNSASYTVRESDGGTRQIDGFTTHSATEGTAGWVKVEEDPSKPGYPKIVADLGGAGEVTLRSLMQSKKLDELVRQFAGMVKSDPQHGEERVERALYGLTCDFDDNCHVTYERMHELTAMHERPTDGASINDVSGHFELKTTFGSLIPRSELGGQLVTIVMVKPLEVLLKQPDPAQTEKWELVNRVQDELSLDEVLLTRQDLESDVAAIDQDQEAFWVGHNSLLFDYSTTGANQQQISGVEMKSSMWTYEIPTSVTATNVNYPDTIPMYPFNNWNGAHAEYTIRQVAAISTSLARGPNPVERIQLFADDPDLVTVE